MKRHGALALLFYTVLLAGLVLSIVHADSSRLQTMNVKIDEPFRFGGVSLPAGEYQLMHDDAKKANGEPCLSIWRFTRSDPSMQQEELASSYCRRVPRTMEPDGRLEISRIRGAGRYYSRRWEMIEIQFPGEDFAHIPQGRPGD